MLGIVTAATPIAGTATGITAHKAEPGHMSTGEVAASTLAAGCCVISSEHASRDVARAVGQSAGSPNCESWSVSIKTAATRKTMERMSLGGSREASPGRLQTAFAGGICIA